MRQADAEREQGCCIRIRGESGQHARLLRRNEPGGSGPGLGLAPPPGLLDAPRDPDTVHIAWQGWTLSTVDFLTTRMMEIVVHSDDLACSVGVPTPEFEEGVVTPVLGLLTGVALRRHGQAALVRALSRPQRAPSSVSAV